MSKTSSIISDLRDQGFDDKAILDALCDGAALAALGLDDGDQLDIECAATALGRKGGLSRSEAKKAAVRENGKRGGRPRKGTRRWMNPATGSVDTSENWEAEYESAKRNDTVEEGGWGKSWNARLVEVEYDGHSWVEAK